MDDSVQQIVAEYLRLKDVGRPKPAGIYQFDDGNTIELCTSNGRDWTVCLVRPPDSALTPLAFGNHEATMARYKAIMANWDQALWPAPRAILEGAARVFVPAGMSFLLGVVEVGRTALLLGVLKRPPPRGDAIALIRFDGRRVDILQVGGSDLRSIHVDEQLALQGRELAAQSTEAAAALLPAFARLLSRAATPNRRAGARNRGRGSVALVIWVFVQLVRMGVEDLIGRLGDIDGQIKAYLPNLELPRDALGDVLVILLKIKTCLVSRQARVMWHIRLSGLNDTASAIHQRFCAEAPTTLVDVCLAGRVCSPESPPPRTKARRRPPTESEPNFAGNGDAEAQQEPAPDRPDAPEQPDASEQPSTSGPPGAPTADDAEPVLLKFIRRVLERTPGS